MDVAESAMKKEELLNAKIRQLEEQQRELEKKLRRATRVARKYKGEVDSKKKQPKSKAQSSGLFSMFKREKKPERSESDEEKSEKHMSWGAPPTYVSADGSVQDQEPSSAEEDMKSIRSALKKPKGGDKGGDVTGDDMSVALTSEPPDDLERERAEEARDEAEAEANTTADLGGTRRSRQRGSVDHADAAQAAAAAAAAASGSDASVPPLQLGELAASQGNAETADDGAQSAAVVDAEEEVAPLTAAALKQQEAAHKTRTDTADKSDGSEDSRVGIEMSVRQTQFQEPAEDPLTENDEREVLEDFPDDVGPPPDPTAINYQQLIDEKRARLAKMERLALYGNRVDQMDEDSDADPYAQSDDDETAPSYSQELDEEYMGHREQLQKRPHDVIHLFRDDGKAALQMMGDIKEDGYTEGFTAYQKLCFPYEDNWFPCPSKKDSYKALARLDWNSYDPFDTFNDYYQPTSVPSGGLLTFGTLALVVLYAFFVINQLEDDNRLQETTFWPTWNFDGIHRHTGDLGLAWGLYSLAPGSTGVAFVLANSMLFNDSAYFKVKYYNVTRVYKRTGQPSTDLSVPESLENWNEAFSETQYELFTEACTVNGQDSLCPSSPVYFNRVRQSNQTVEIFTRVQFEVCDGLNDDLTKSNPCRKAYLVPPGDPAGSVKYVPCDATVNSSCFTLDSYTCKYNDLSAPAASDPIAASTIDGSGNFTCRSFVESCTANSTHDCLSCVDLIGYHNTSASYSPDQFESFTRFTNDSSLDRYQDSLYYANCSFRGIPDRVPPLAGVDICRWNPIAQWWCSAQKVSNCSTLIQFTGDEFRDLSNTAFYNTDDQATPNILSFTNRMCIVEEVCPWPRSLTLDLPLNSSQPSDPETLQYGPTTADSVQLTFGLANCTAETKCQTPCVDQAFQQENYAGGHFVFSTELPTHPDFDQFDLGLLNKVPDYGVQRVFPFRSDPWQVFAEATFGRYVALVKSITVRKDKSVQYLRYEKDRTEPRLRSGNSSVIFQLDFRLDDTAYQATFLGFTSMDTASLIGGMFMIVKFFLAAFTFVYVKRAFSRTRKFVVDPVVVKTILRKKADEVNYYKDKLSDIRANDVMRLSMDEMFEYLNGRRDAEVSTFKWALFKSMHIKEMKIKQEEVATSGGPTNKMKQLRRHVHEPYELDDEMKEKRDDHLQQLIRQDELARADDPELVRLLCFFTLEEVERQQHVMKDFIEALATHVKE